MLTSSPGKNQPERSAIKIIMHFKHRDSISVEGLDMLNSFHNKSLYPIVLGRPRTSSIYIFQFFKLLRLSSVQMITLYLPLPLSKPYSARHAQVEIGSKAQFPKYIKILKLSNLTYVFKADQISIEMLADFCLFI